MSNRTKRKVANPVTVFSSCPCCKSKELIALDVDVLCARCDWMSTEYYVASGGMDQVFNAARAHLGLAKQSNAVLEEPVPNVEVTLDIGA